MWDTGRSDLCLMRDTQNSINVPIHRIWYTWVIYAVFSVIRAPKRI